MILKILIRLIAIPKRGTFTAFSLLLTAIVLLTATRAVVAQTADEKLRIESVKVGFNGFYKVGSWTPVQVLLVGGEEPMTGEIFFETQDGDGEATRIGFDVPTREGNGRALPRRVLVPARTQVNFSANVRFGRVNDPELTVRFVVDGKSVTTKRLTVNSDRMQEVLPTPMLTSQELIVSVGPRIGLEREATTIAEGYKTRNIELVNLQDIFQLPTRWYGYEGVDAVVITTSRPEIFEQAGKAWIEALQQWVRMGGRLLLSVGANGDQILRQPPAEADSGVTREPSLADFSPGRFVDTISVSSTAAFHDYANSTTALEWATSAGRPPDISQLEDVRGHVEIAERQTGLPLAIRYPFGMGEVIFLAVDIDRPPFSDWKDQGKLLSRLLSIDSQVSDGQEMSAQSFQYSGYDDLSGQLRASLDHEFTGVTTVSFSLVALLVVIYILLIGPVDYLLVKRVFKRTELTWITFPTIVLAVSFGAYWLASYLKGDQLRVNQVDIVDVDEESGFVRGTSWINIFSPQPENYSLSLLPDIFSASNIREKEVLLSWWGLPGTALGGMQSQTLPALFRRPYEIKPELGRISEVPIQVWSTKGFAGRWNGRIDVEPSSLFLPASNGAIQGTLTNHFDVNLVDCELFFGEWVYRIGEIGAGEQIRISEDSVPLSPQSGVLGTQQVRQGDYVQAKIQDYNHLELNNVSRMLRVMMVYDLVGGKPVVGELDHHYYGFIDCSPLIKAGRAVLIGRGPGAKDAAGLLDDGTPLSSPQDRHWTYYRVVMPVQRNVAVKN